MQWYIEWNNRADIDIDELPFAACMRVSSYDNPTQFKSDMRKMATMLRSHGL